MIRRLMIGIVHINMSILCVKKDGGSANNDFTFVGLLRNPEFANCQSVPYLKTYIYET